MRMIRISLNYLRNGKNEFYLVKRVRSLKQEQPDEACGAESTKLPKNLTIKRCPKDGE